MTTWDALMPILPVKGKHALGWRKKPVPSTKTFTWHAECKCGWVTDVKTKTQMEDNAYSHWVTS